MSEWISVKDRLPDRYEYVIMCRKGGNVEQGFLVDTSRHFFGGPFEWHRVDGGYEVYDVTHWMPLPAPPKEE